MKILERPPLSAASSAHFSLEAIASDTEGESFAKAVVSGLGSRPKTLPCRFFYDERGSLLFEAITELEEYYPTRVEREILADSAPAIARAIGPAPELIELGSGSAAKTRLLIEALIAEHGQLLFRPIDISPTILEDSSRALLADYPELEIHALAAEYEPGLQRVAKTDPECSRLVAWLGSSIGNLTRDAAAVFLGRLRGMLRKSDRVLIGFDRRKDRETLERAYDDAKGVTAEFNLNLLERANRELGADFDTTRFEHRAVWREVIGRVEMHLVSRSEQQVRIEELDSTVEFESGETIHTENSYKYSPEEITLLAQLAGLELEQRWSDADGRFELSLLRAA
jgi:L-histidine N-alpha-methyltransferase